MSKADYALCVKCDGKVFYDAEIDYDVPTFGAQWVLCSDCATPELVGIVGAVIASDNLIVKDGR